MSGEAQRSTAGDEPPAADGMAVPLDYVPARSPNVLELDMGDGVILYSRDSDLVHHLNPSAGVVWQLCDGSASVGVLATDIAAAYDLDPVATEAQVAGVVAELAALGLLRDPAEPPP
ncbi:MAG TPA: PqqD family protein [Acidimicrobiales bacterium]|nr:PqqD family protein [Acidimicrobiales bacterium]